MAAILSQWPAEASGAVGGPFALVETVGVDARVRRVQLEVAGAARPCPVLRGVEQCLADAARALCVVNRQIFDPDALAEAHRLDVGVSRDEPSDRAIYLGDEDGRVVG